MLMPGPETLRPLTVMQDLLQALLASRYVLGLSGMEFMGARVGRGHRARPLVGLGPCAGAQYYLRHFPAMLASDSDFGGSESA